MASEAERLPGQIGEIGERGPFVETEENGLRCTIAWLLYLSRTYECQE